jgi:PTS system nitrogen regulatory IIA component
MLLSELVTPDRINCAVSAQSKKRALEQLSEIISNSEDTISSNDVFESLLARERLGGTGVGYGVAIPHGRLKNSEHTLGAFIKLDNGVDYDAADRQPVDLLFALIVPENSTEEHLQILANLAKLFSDTAVRQQIRDANNSEQIYQLLQDWEQHQ